MILNRLKQARRQKRAKEQLADSVRAKSNALALHLQNLTLHSSFAGTHNNQSEPRLQPIVVSLTTFDKRINDVFLTIESIFQQSLKADKVVLWISKDDFSQEDLPMTLKHQMNRGLEVEFCEKDLGPHTKYFYALKKYPDSLIVTVDDDILYPIDMLDQLYRAYKKEPNVIHCNRGHKMLIDNSGNVQPYRQWQKSVSGSQASPLIFPTGVGGVLYFPGCFDEEVTHREAFERMSPNADDVWLKAMSLKKGVLCKSVADTREWSQRYLVIEGSQKFTLKRKNKSADTGNDVQINKVFEKYGLAALMKI